MLDPGPCLVARSLLKAPGAPGTRSQKRGPWGTRRLSSRTRVTGTPGLSPEAAGRVPAPHSAKVAAAVAYVGPPKFTCTLNLST